MDVFETDLMYDQKPSLKKNNSGEIYEQTIHKRRRNLNSS